MVNTHSVGLRHKALNIQREIIMKKQKNKNNSSEDLFECSSDRYEKCLEFGKPTYPMWLDFLQPEWTVIQITESWRGKQGSKLLGGPPGYTNLPTLTLIRFPCGKRQGSILVKELDKPSGEVVGGGLLNELNSILDGNRRVNKDYRGNVGQYWKVKQEHHNQLKVCGFLLFYFLALTNFSCL